MPRTTTPFDLYCMYSFDRSGISFLQGAHHVAQKLMTTTLPFSESGVYATPFVSMYLTLGRHSLPRHAACASPDEQLASDANITNTIAFIETSAATTVDHLVPRSRAARGTLR